MRRIALPAAAALALCAQTALAADAPTYTIKQLTPETALTAAQAALSVVAR